MKGTLKRVAHKLLGAHGFLVLVAMFRIHFRYEPKYHNFLKALPQSATLVDIGAHAGITCAIAHRLRPDINLIAFEPLPSNIRALRSISQIYGVKVRLEPVALSDSIGSVDLATPVVDGSPTTGLTHIVSEEFQNADVNRHPYSTVTVPMKTLDSFSFERIDAIKIDVEDHEYHALSGARSTLQRHRPIVFCELWTTPNRQKVLDLMQSLSYTCEQVGEIDFVFHPA